MDTAIRTATVTRRSVVEGRSGWVLLWGNGAGLIAALVLLFNAASGSPTLRVGQVAPETVIARHQVPYTDWNATQVQRERARASVTPTYRTDTRLATLRNQQAASFLTKARGVIASSMSLEQKVRALQALLPVGVSGAYLQQFPSLTPAELNVVGTRSLALLAQAGAWRFDANERDMTVLALLSSVPSRVNLLERTAIGEVLTTFLAPTTVEDVTATQRDRQAAAARVAPVRALIYSGEVVVRRGDIVTATTMEKLRALGLENPQASWQDVLGAALFAAAIVIILFWYLFAFHLPIMSNGRLLFLIDVAILGTVIGARLLSTGHVLLPYFLPAATAPLFASVLVAPEACVAVAAAMAILAGWVVSGSFELTMYYFVSTTAGILVVRQLRELRQFIFAGLAISLAGFAVIVAFNLADRTYDFVGLQEELVGAGFNGFVSSTLALGSFALLSGFFGVTTSLKLLELAQPTQPILRRLTTRAPGTYNHSLLVSSMVERAAEDVGANPLVAKVAALYHDCGKTANPHCFVENQLGIGNIHDEMAPEESGRIIRGHVPQGLRLAKQHRLPKVIQDAIAEHHGTMTIQYFLHRAIQESDGDPVDESIFTYPGPKPQSKETAIIMLADGCESAVRASPDHSATRIREIVNMIFRERVEQGQLDECPLTLQDLERAREAFCSVLTGLYHPRIEYPEAAELKARPVLMRRDAP